jgi:tripartite-type tricarboxylate transporter receptor subunit TctC
MSRTACRLLAIGFVLGLIAQISSAFGQENFYKGKTIRLIVGLAPGGGFDAYSRVIARHIGKHIPGNPTTVVDNMPGAASLLAANYVYKVARPDGLTIGNFVGGLSFQQMLGLPGVEYDRRGEVHGHHERRAVEGVRHGDQDWRRRAGRRHGRHS